MLLSVINMLHGKLLLINPLQSISMFCSKAFSHFTDTFYKHGYISFFYFVCSRLLISSHVFVLISSNQWVSRLFTSPHFLWFFFSLNKGLSYISSNTWLTSQKLHNIRYEIDILTHCCEKKLFDNCSLGAFTTLMDYTLIQTIYGICVSYKERVAKSNW